MRLPKQKKLLRFMTDDEGVITVDWIVLTAAAMLGCFAFIYVLNTGTRNIGHNVTENLDLVGEHVVEDATAGLTK